MNLCNVSASSSRWLALSLAGALGLGAAAGCSSEPVASEDDISDDVRGGQAGGLTDAERQEFSHLGMGNETTPLAWLRALENDDGSSFVASLGRFGFLSDPSSKDALPIGIAVAKRGGVEYFGVTCAGCHIRQIDYKGQSLRIDGAPNPLSTDPFSRALVGNVMATVGNPARLQRFAEKAMPSVAARATAKQT